VERKNARRHDGIRDCTSTARPSATASWTMTAITTKPKVFRNATRTVGSAPMSAKLSTPTNSGLLMMSQRKKASRTEAKIGTTVKRNRPATVGARNSHTSKRWDRRSGASIAGWATCGSVVAVVVGVTGARFTITSPSGPARGRVAWSAAPAPRCRRRP
jgi:hypothetical protein